MASIKHNLFLRKQPPLPRKDICCPLFIFHHSFVHCLCARSGALHRVSCCSRRVRPCDLDWRHSSDCRSRGFPCYGCKQIRGRVRFNSSQCWAVFFSRYAFLFASCFPSALALTLLQRRPPYVFLLLPSDPFQAENQTCLRLHVQLRCPHG